MFFHYGLCLHAADYVCVHTAKTDASNPHVHDWSKKCTANSLYVPMEIGKSVHSKQKQISWWFCMSTLYQIDMHINARWDDVVFLSVLSSWWLLFHFDMNVLDTQMHIVCFCVGENESAEMWWSKTFLIPQDLLVTSCLHFYQCHNYYLEWTLNDWNQDRSPQSNPLFVFTVFHGIHKDLNCVNSSSFFWFFLFFPNHCMIL